MKFSLTASAPSPITKRREHGLPTTPMVAVMALRRTVGLVLPAGDQRVADDATKRRIDDAWERLKREMTPMRGPHIFHDFIDNERDQVVHLYDVGAQVGNDPA